ncbi:MAG: response regulator [Cyanothece sp. SIO2G6]|nr:response regulator [Cyanothece sp. SIO2G6]
MASHKILVIDDSRVIRNMVRDMLPQGNFEVLEAKDGLEGMASIEQELPNLIMLDFLLPKMSGWEVFQKIQEHAEYQKIPLVLMSGRKEEVTEKIQEPFEFFEFVEKPFEKKDLVSAIKLAMAKAKKRPATVKVSSTPQAAPSTATANSAVNPEEMAAMKAQMAKMQAEIDALKKQTAQILNFIKQKLR